MRLPSPGCAVVLFASFVSLATAGPITVTADSGNFGDNVGTLGIGLNTISGSISDAGNDEDLVYVTLPAGVEISSGEWIITDFETSFGSQGYLDEPLNGDLMISGNDTINLNTPYSTPGNLEIEVANLESCNTATPPVCGDAGFDWSLQYTVESASTPSAPEPASAILVIAGLAAFGLRRFRRTQ